MNKMIKKTLKCQLLRRTNRIKEYQEVLELFQFKKVAFLATHLVKEDKEDYN